MDDLHSMAENAMDGTTLIAMDGVAGWPR